MKKLLFLLALCVILLSGCVVYVDGDGFFTIAIIEEAKARILSENPGLDLAFFEFSAGVSQVFGTTERKDTTIDDLIWWRFAFDCGDGRTATIYKENDAWQPSHITSLIFPGASIFDSDYLRIDLDEAIEILKISHLGGGATDGNLFEMVSFSQPLHPDVTEPLYIFRFAGRPSVTVGAITGIVKTE